MIIFFQVKVEKIKSLLILKILKKNHKIKASNLNSMTIILNTLRIIVIIKKRKQLCSRVITFLIQINKIMKKEKANLNIN